MLDGASRVPASGGPPRSVVVLHGYGSNGADLISLVPYWQAAFPDTLFLAPDAPQPCPASGSGRQWWPLNSLSRVALAAGVRLAAPSLNAYTDTHLRAHGLSDERLALVGFSQGTMMALHVGPRRPSAMAGIVGYSGMLANPEALAREVVTKPPVLLVHGSADPVLPVAALRQAGAELGSVGFAVQTHVSNGLAHSVDAKGLELGAEFLAARFGPD